METRGHRITLREEPRLVTVAVRGETLAASTRVVVLEETGLPARSYFPRADVRMEHLRSSTTETACPFKGAASYWSFEADGSSEGDVAWSYESPIEGMERIAGHICFFDERVDVTIDGRAQDRPVTPWSPAT